MFETDTLKKKNHMRHVLMMRENKRREELGCEGVISTALQKRDDIFHLSL